DGDDSLTGDVGDDTIYGGAGFDVLDYSQETGASGIELDMGSSAFTLYDPYDALGDVTAYVVTDTNGYHDTVTGFEGVLGTAYADTLIGDAGDNLFEGGDGNDSLVGGAGEDTLSYQHLTGLDYGVDITLSDSADAYAVAGPHDDETDTITGFEHVFGSDLADTITGNSQDNELRGWGAEDLIHGGGGADTLYGGEGFDTLYGGDGADHLYGDSEDDLLFGDNGADHLEGGLGDDTLVGGAGNDTLDGGDGLDTVDYGQEGGTSGVDVNLATGLVTDSFGDTDTILHVESVIGTGHDDILFGDIGTNTLLGGAGDDVINGGLGNDVLVGGAGADTLTGGAGCDTFEYAAGDGGDLITDYSSDDSIYVHDAQTFTAIDNYDPSTSTLGSSSATVIWDDATQTVWYDADGNGSGAAECLATVHGDDVHLNAGDFGLC
ncbi:MAG: calcium-binding protein, partial [Desulfovibrionaceae bacterium]